MLTAYDSLMAGIIDKAGIDTILVGDSLGNVILGLDSTLKVTMDEMIIHCRAVSRGGRRAMVIADMPFMSYQVSDEEAVRNAGRFVQEAGCDAVKIEGGRDSSVSRIEAVLGAGIPVLGHIGLEPQSVKKIGGYRVRGRNTDEAEKLLSEAERLERSGCFALVLECVPSSLGALITSKINIPTIGIGAGPDCDGQVLVTHDLIGYFEGYVPKFVKRYADVSAEIDKAVSSYREDVLNGRFPGPENSFK
jgi:3-methyl-2-oxobutanoate hydroxymethyltransferase